MFANSLLFRICSFTNSVIIAALDALSSAFTNPLRAEDNNFVLTLLFTTMLSIDNLVAISLAAKFLAFLSGIAKIPPPEKL